MGEQAVKSSSSSQKTLPATLTATGPVEQDTIAEQPDFPSLSVLIGTQGMNCRPAQIMQLQRTIGNRAVNRLFQLQRSTLPRSAAIRRTADPLPDPLKTGIEGLSGLSMDDVNVHYQSDQPKAINALAYAQGSDIYLGSNQEAHLPHEAWHVVQQKQGRASVTAQHMGQALNADAGLEAEADSMGAQASIYTGESRPLQARAAPASGVMQARFPNMSDEFIDKTTEMARDILLNTIDNLTKAEMAEINEYLEQYGTVYTKEILRDSVKGGIPFIKYWRTIFQDKLGAGKKIALEDTTKADIIGVGSDSKKLPKILEQIRVIFDQLNSAKAQPFLNIFGEEKAHEASDVVGKISSALRMHLVKNTSPISILGDTAHAKWVGVEGATPVGSMVIQLRGATANALLEGDADAQAAVVHEFSHAVADTKDSAYSLSEIAKLTPDERVKNAETYAQFYLELLMPNPARYFNPDLVVDTGSPSGGTASPFNKRVAAVHKNVVDMWNRVDNLYSMMKIVLRRPEELRGNEVHVRNFSRWVWYAVTPHLLDYLSYPTETMALIEDRTRALNKLKNREIANALRLHPEAIEPITETESASRYRNMTAFAIANALHMGEPLAGEFIDNVRQIPSDPQTLIQKLNEK